MVYHYEMGGSTPPTLEYRVDMMKRGLNLLHELFRKSKNEDERQKIRRSYTGLYKRYRYSKEFLEKEERMTDELEFSPKEELLNNSELGRLSA